VSAMEGKFEWACEKGKVLGRVQRAPTAKVELQVIDFGGIPNT
jgi:D-alanyl-D-alanine-carboxypeptidase/D-alanyl-D-alanine-endopeptidase